MAKGWFCALLRLLIAVSMQAVSTDQRVYSDSKLNEFAAAVRNDGYVLIPGLLDPKHLDDVRVAFRPYLEKRMRTAPPDRGPQRFYTTPPFKPPFSDSRVWQQPDLLGVVKRLLGEEAVMCQWAVDTPLKVKEQFVQAFTKPVALIASFKIVFTLHLHFRAARTKEFIEMRRPCFLSNLWTRARPSLSILPRNSRSTSHW